MKNFTNSLIGIWEHLASPAFIWKVMVRRDFGRAYLLSKTNKVAMLIPVIALIAPNPFTGKLLIEGSFSLVLFIWIAMCRISYVIIKLLLGKERTDIQSTHRGDTLAVVKRLFPFLKTETQVKLYGEPTIPLLIGAIFYLTDFYPYFGIILLYIGFWHLLEEYGQSRISPDRVIQKADQLIQSEKENEELDEAKERIEKRENGKEDKVFEVG